MSFQYLPTELYDAILNFLPSSDLQHTALAVTRAIPLAPVRQYHLFRSIRITHPEQAVSLYRRLRHRSRYVTDDEGHLPSEEEKTAGWVKEFFVEAWSVDAEIVINLVRILPNLELMKIWIGPSNFLPEHLEELFSQPLLSLSYLALRFRPYVQKATYYQFLKGAYFDSALVALARWPSGTLCALSIVQDPFIPRTEQKLGFAQPIVFFRLDACASILLHSPAFSPSLKALRFQIPSRPVARSLCNPPISGLSSIEPDSHPPNLEFLDLSTCGVLESEVDTILVRFPTLKHIVLDGCGILRGELREGEWNALGKRCALVGIKRAREREKEFKAWLEIRSLSSAGLDVEVNANRPFSKSKRGRKGLSTATISFRTQDTNTSSSSSPPILNVPVSQTSINRGRKIRILPSPPSLSSIAITISPLVTPEKYPIIRAEFEAGWAEGVALLAVTIARLKTSARNGFRIMKSCALEDQEESEDPLTEGLEGLEDVRAGDDAAFRLSSDSEDSAGSLALAPPILCFVGSNRDESHEKNCGHNVGWDFLGSDL